MPSRFVLLAIAACLGAAWLFVLTDIPLGIPGATPDAPVEWTWPRHLRTADERVDLWIGTAMAALVAAGYISFARLGLKRIGTARTTGRCVLLVSLIAMGFIWMSFAQKCAPYAFASIKPNYVLYDPGASGYFFESVRSEETTAEFLANYEDVVASGDDVLHIGTHPPGLFLFNRGLLAMCEQSPALSDAVLATQSKRFDDAFRIFESTARIGQPLNRSQKAALWLSVLLTQFCAALTVWPLYSLVRQSLLWRGRGKDDAQRMAWMAACFWPLIPAVSVFLPKSDVAYAFLFTACIPLWLFSLRRHSRTSIACGTAFLTGVLVAFNAIISLAVLPVCVLLVLMTLIGVFCQRRDETDRGLSVKTAFLLASCATAGLCLSVAVVWLACDLNLPRVWFFNLKNHAAFYDQFTRTTWKWLLLNPIELFLAAGPPIGLLALRGFWRSFASSDSNRRWQLSMSAGAVITWSLLWLSSKNSGEAARLWIFLMPWGLWLGAHAFRNEKSSSETVATRREWAWLLAIQAAICAITVGHVAGFHLS